MYGLSTHHQKNKNKNTHTEVNVIKKLDVIALLTSIAPACEKNVLLSCRLCGVGPSLFAFVVTVLLHTNTTTPQSPQELRVEVSGAGRSCSPRGLTEAAGSSRAIGALRKCCHV